MQGSWLRVPQIVTGVVAAVGITLHLTDGLFGTALPPFVSAFGLRASLWALAAVALVLIAVPARRFLETLRPSTFAVCCFVLALSLGLGLNAARSGPAAWDNVFTQRSFESVNEYLPGLPAVDYGVYFYLDRVAELVPALPVNVAGHPPGPLLLLHWLGIRDAAGLAALCIGVGSLTAPLTYALARGVGSEERARSAALLCAFSPGLLLFGATSFDYVFAALGTGAAALLVRGGWWRVLGCVAFACAAMFSWALLAVGPLCALLVLQHEGWRRAVILAVGCGVAVLALNGLLAVAYGYDPIGTLRATDHDYVVGIASTRPYLFWLFGSPVAWAVSLGLPISAAALRALARREPAALALAAVVVVCALGGFTKAETERIWLFLIPWACLAAAGRRPSGRTLWLLGLQGLVTSLCFSTIW